MGPEFKDVQKPIAIRRCIRYHACRLEILCVVKLEISTEIAESRIGCNKIELSGSGNSSLDMLPIHRTIA